MPITRPYKRIPAATEYCARLCLSTHLPSADGLRSSRNNHVPVPGVCSTEIAVHLFSALRAAHARVCSATVLRLMCMRYRARWHVYMHHGSWLNRPYQKQP